MDKKRLTDAVIAECFDDIQSEIKNRTATVSQDFISRGMNTTVCTNKLIAVYCEEFACRIDRIISFIENRVLILDWDYLEKQLHKHAEQIFSKAEGAACRHLVDAGLASTIPCYRLDIAEKKKEALGVISNKIRLVNMLQSSTARRKENWYQSRAIQAAIISAIVAILLTCIGWFISKNNGAVNIQENQNTGNQAFVSNKGEGNISVTQNIGVDPNQYGESKKALGKTEHELELTKKEKQELENIVNAYKREDKEKRAILERSENREKTKLIVKIFQGHDRGVIAKEDALKLSDMVNKTSWDNLKEFLENKNVKIDSHNQSLVVAGIFEVRVRPGPRGRERYNPATIEYVLTSEGNKLFEIASDK